MENKQKYPCIETTLDYERGSFLIRLWLNETEIKRKTYPEIIKTSEELFGLNSIPPEITKYDQYLNIIYNLLIEKLTQIPNINAFQKKNMIKLNNIAKLLSKGHGRYYGNDVVSVSVIYDLFRDLLELGVEEVLVTQSEMSIIIQYYLANAGNDKSGKTSEVLTNGRLDKFLGVNLALEATDKLHLEDK